MPVFEKWNLFQAHRDIFSVFICDQTIYWIIRKGTIKTQILQIIVYLDQIRQFSHFQCHILQRHCQEQF